MPLGVDNFVHENTGTTTAGTSHVVSLAAPGGVQDVTTAGNTVVVAFYAGGAQPTNSGFTLAKSQASSTWVLYKLNAAAGESSWTFTTASSLALTWYVAEMSGVDPVLPVDATAGATATVGNGGTVSTGTTPLNAGLSTVAFAVWGVNAGTGSWDGYTNGFTEVADLSNAAGPSTLAVARLFENSTTRTFESTATLTTSAGTPTTNAVMVVFRAADSPVVAPLAGFFGYEQGTHGGVAVGGAVSPFAATLSPSGTWGTNYLIQAGSARSSSYGLRIVQSGAAAFVAHGTLSSFAAAFGFNVRVVSATGAVTVAEVTNNSRSTVFAQLRYDTSTSKFGVRCGTTGTVQWESGTTALNTFRWVDLRFRCNISTWTADWRIETGADTYTDQAQATLAGQSTGGNFDEIHLGANAAQTVTADFDDVVISTYYAAYPLGPHEIRLLTVDPAGTPTVSGTAANFKVITANGTIGAWDATGARNAIDEVPVTISAAADAVAQVTAAATEYMEFPMADPTLAADEYINGVRMLSAIGSGTGAGAGDFAIRGYDGTTETALATVSQLTPGSPTAITSTVPLWRCAMWQSTNGWTLAELVAAVLRAGYSGDATPDMWLHAAYLEYAVGKTTTQQLFGDFATAQVDPTRLGVMSVTVTAPPGGDASLYYETNTVPSTVPVATETSVTQQLDSASAADANYIAFYPPPEGVPDA